MFVELTAAKNRLAIKFGYNPALIAKVKTLGDRRWHAADGRWTAALTAENIDKLREWGFRFHKDVAAATVKKKNVNLPPAVREALDGYQIEAVERIEAFGGRALVADDPGLGKTVECLAWLAAHPELRPAVIIPKKAGKLVWHRDALKGIMTPGGRVPMLPGERVQIINGRARIDIDADVVIANYDIAAELEECPYCKGDGERGGIKCKDCAGTGDIAFMRSDIEAVNAKVVILDEGQQIMNRGAQRSSAVIKYASRSPHLIVATASPIKKRPIQFFNVLNLIAPKEFPSRTSYGIRYCGGKQNGYGWNFNGASNLDKLNEILVSKLMIRRTKKQVMKDLPAVRRTVVPLEIDSRAEYNLAERDYLAWLKTRGGGVEKIDRALKAEALTKRTALFSLAAKIKTDMVIEWITDFLESGNKLIVFTMHTPILERIYNEFKSIAVRLDGSTSDKERARAEDRFQNDPACLLFVGNSVAAGDTITLTAAYDVAFAELPDTPEDVKQNEGRAYGRKNDPHGINSYFLVVADSVEEGRADELNLSARVVRKVLDGEDVGEQSIVKGGQ